MTIEIDLEPGDVVNHRLHGIGTVTASADEFGQVAIDGPGFESEARYSDHSLELIARPRYKADSITVTPLPDGEPITLTGVRGREFHDADDGLFDEDPAVTGKSENVMGPVTVPLFIPAVIALTTGRSIEDQVKRWAAKAFRVPVHNIGAVMFAAGPGRSNPHVLIGFIHDDEMEDATYELEDTSVAEFITEVLSA